MEISGLTGDAVGVCGFEEANTARATGPSYGEEAVCADPEHSSPSCDTHTPHEGEGCLVLVGTPIGNLGDMSPRALEALRGCDCVCAEDTRVAGKLLSAFGLHVRLERCDENVIAQRCAGLVERMLAGERVGFVSDAGMPAVADPGARLVDACLDAGVPVDVVPGPSAVTCAIAHAGFSCPTFYFGGFVPRKDGERERLFSSLAPLPSVLVFYESPHRVVDTLSVVARVFPRRRAALLRELTKMHQEILRAPAARLAEEVSRRENIKGEMVIVIDAPDDDELRETNLGERSFEDEARAGLAAGTTKSVLAKQLARDFGMSKSQVYDRLLWLERDVPFE